MGGEAESSCIGGASMLEQLRASQSFCADVHHLIEKLSAIANSTCSEVITLVDQGIADAEIEQIGAEQDGVEPSSLVATLSTAAFLLMITWLVFCLGRVLHAEWVTFQSMVEAHPHDKDKLWQFMSYRIDVWISETTSWREYILGLFTLVLVFVGGVAYKVTTGFGLGKSLWTAWVFVVDSGAHGDQEQVLHRLVALVITIGGMIGFAMMVSVLTDGLQQYMEGVRSGRTNIICHDHSLIIGWSDKTIPLIQEILEANRSEGGGTIVVLCETPRADVEDEIACRVHDRKGSTIVVRSGNAMMLHDLKMVSIHTVRSIMVLADMALPPAQRDEKTIRIMLSLRCAMTHRHGNNVGLCLKDAMAPASPMPLYSLSDLNQYQFALKRRSANGFGQLNELALADLNKSNGSDKSIAHHDPHACSIAHEKADDDSSSSASEGHQYNMIIELADIDNAPLVSILGGASVESLVTHDFTGRMILQASRHESMARVLEHIIGFEGSEFYISLCPEVIDRSFGEIAFMFADAVPLGVYFANGEHILNPASDYVFKVGDRLIVLAEDNDTFKPNAEPFVNYTPGSFGKASHNQDKPLKILICGWRRDFGDFLAELDSMSVRGTSVTLISPTPLEDRDNRLSENGRNAHMSLQNITIHHHQGDQTVRRVLEKLPIESYDEVIVVSEEEFEADATKCDVRTCTTMLQVQDIRRTRPAMNPHFSLTVEVLDPRSRELIQRTNLAEYVMSNTIIASAMAMVSEEPKVACLVREILSSTGTEVYLYEAAQYMKASESLSFFEVSARCRDSNEILLGYILDSCIVLNPCEKSAAIEWSGKETLIVLTQGEASLHSKASAGMRSRQVSAGSSSLSRQVSAGSGPLSRQVSPASAGSLSKRVSPHTAGPLS